LRVLVVGAGATGGYFGGRLAEAGRDVTFLVRAQRAEQLRAQGLQILSPHGDVTLHPQLVTPATLASTYDLVVVSVKAYALAAAIDDFAPAVGPHTLLLPVLNGIRHLDLLAARFGARAVLGGVCIVVTTVDTEGRIVQLADMEELNYGDRHDPESAPVVALDPVLQGAGFASRRSAHIDLEMWEKWVFLATLGATTCLMRGTVGQIVAAPGGHSFAEAVLAECTAIAAASGHPIRDAWLERTRNNVTAPGSSLASSMYRDLIRGQPIEADQIIGDLVKRAGALGVAAPLLALAFTHLCVYQASRGAPAGG
jgi:2-dehydropantoate 2-reductase